MNNPKNIRMTVLATAIAAACTLANAQDVTLFENHVLPEAVVFEPSSTLGMNSEIDIIVKGPNGFMTRQSFQAGEPIELNPATLAEGGLPDGTYRYELQIVDIKGISAHRNANGVSDAVHRIFRIPDSALSPCSTASWSLRISKKRRTQAPMPAPRSKPPSSLPPETATSRLVTR